MRAHAASCRPFGSQGRLVVYNPCDNNPACDRLRDGLSRRLADKHALDCGFTVPVSFRGRLLVTRLMVAVADGRNVRNVCAAIMRLTGFLLAPYALLGKAWISGVHRHAVGVLSDGSQTRHFTLILAFGG